MYHNFEVGALVFTGSSMNAGVICQKKNVQMRKILFLKDFSPYRIVNKMLKKALNEVD